MTGDPKRQVSFGSYNLNRKPPTALAFDQLTFPACEQCSHDFSDLEGRAREATERLLGKRPLTSTDFNCLLDWLDKVRTGMWLGLLWLRPVQLSFEKRIGSATALYRTVALSFVIPSSRGICSFADLCWTRGTLYSNKIVISTGVYPDFLPRSTRNDRVCGFQ
jgi:hypothetical protein